MTSQFPPLTPQERDEMRSLDESASLSVDERGRLAELRIRDDMQPRHRAAVWENLFVMGCVGVMNGALVFAISRSLALSLAVGGLSALVMLFALALGRAASDS